MTDKPLRVDLHVHTNHSKDSRASPGSMIKRALALGLDAIAVTDHDTVSGSLEAMELARGTPLLVIPGQEIRTRDGEIIVLGIKKDLPGRLPALDTMKMARNSGGFVIVPHPFDRMRKGLGNTMTSCLKYIDAVEVFNARTIFNKFNKKAMSFAREHSLPMTSGSDGHFPEEMGKSYLLVHSPRDIQSILEAVRSGRTELVMNRQARASRLKRGLLKIRTYF